MRSKISVVVNRILNEMEMVSGMISWVWKFCFRRIGRSFMDVVSDVSMIV